jgi:predicted PurR-regulated permease PerM
VAKATLDNLSHLATALLTILFIGIFGALDPDRYKAGMVRLFPLPMRDRADEVLREIGQTLRWWLIGRAIGMTLIGVSTMAVLALLGMPYAVLLGVLAGVLEFVPYLGPIIAGVPIVVLSLLDSPQTALYVVGAYAVVQTIESYLLEPLIMQRTVLVPPAFTLFMQVLMGALFGIVGIVMATPFAAVLHVLMRTVYREDVLGEKKAR